VFEAWLTAMLVLLPVFALQNLFVWKMPPMLLARMGPERATRLVADFLQGLEEGRVGFPSGFFSVDKVEGGRIVATEMVSWPTSMLSLAKRIIRLSLIFGPIGAIVAIALIVTLGLFIGLAVVIVEFLAKLFLRSRITASVVAVPGTVNSEVVFTTRGPSAHLLRQRIEQAFDVPKLPDDVRFRALGPSIDSQRQSPVNV